MSTHSPSTHLDIAECWRLLEQNDVGRLALTGEDGEPDIFPVNFVAYEGAIFIRTAPDIKAVLLATHAAVAFEVDAHNDLGWRSVVVRGTAARVDDPIVIERSGIRGLATVSPRHKPQVLKITAAVVTGRHFPDHPAAPARDAPTENSGPASPNLASAAGRPIEIASHPPLADHP